MNRKPHRQRCPECGGRMEVAGDAGARKPEGTCGRVKKIYAKK